jgi:protein O-GlcNAc transferase
MTSELKKLYWNISAGNFSELKTKLASIFYEVVTRLKFKPVKSKPHCLPNPLIISLTSYPPRFNKLHLTLQCLLNQRTAPDLIVLWVSEKDSSLITKKVLDLRNRTGFEIRTCPDLGPGTKILPALKEYKDCFIVTADDDIYYGPNWLRNLVDDWNDNEKIIIANRVHRIILKPNGLPMNYEHWQFDINGYETGVLNFATGVGGVLYPPNCFHYEVTNFQSYLVNCHRQDDVWLYWMSIKNGFTVRKCKNSSRLIAWLGTDATGLYINNFRPNGNNAAIERMIKAYGLPYF